MPTVSCSPLAPATVWNVAAPSVPAVVLNSLLVS